MAEFKRIMHNRRLCASLLLILFLNGFLYVREQASRNYGLDCTLPSALLSVNLSGGKYEAVQRTVDGREAYSRYLQLLGEYKALVLTNAIKTLEVEKVRLTNILMISNLLKDDSANSISNTLEQYREERPELVQQLENGEIELDEVQLDYVAVNNLLIQAEYLNGYADYLDSIQANKDQLLSFSIFNNPNGFSGRNIVKTAEEFDALEGVSLTLGSDGAITAFMGFPLTDYLLLCVLVLICIAFLDERRKGLWSVVRATQNGRLRLAMQRTAILLSVSITSTLALYGSNLLIGFSVYGGIDDLGRAAQSVEELSRMPLRCTIGQFLIQYLLFKIGATFLIALLLWLIFTAINNVKYTILAAAGMLVVEYSLYTFLPVQSGWNLFKYFNIFTYIDLSDLYVNYLNIDLFSYPVGIRTVSQFACLPLILVLVLVCITIHCSKRPADGKDLLGQFAYCFNLVTDGALRYVSLLGMELYKTLVIQKGVLILLLFSLLVSNLSFAVTIPIESNTDAVVRQYTSELEGEITAETLQRIDAIQTELDESIAVYEQAKIQYEKGEMEYPQYDVFAREAETAQIRSNGLDIVRKRILELRSIGEEKGFTPWLIEESLYKGTYGEEAKSNRQGAALVAMLTLALLLAGSMSYEVLSGINSLLASAYRGRGELLRRKIGLAVIISTVIWFIIYGLEFYTFFSVCDRSALAAPVQNLSAMGNLSIICSVGEFLVGVYLFCWVALFTCSMLVMLISSYMNRMETTYIAVCSLILLPSVLYFYVGLKPMRYLSLALPVEVIPLVEADQTLALLCIVFGLHILMIGLAIYVLSKKLRV